MPALPSVREHGISAAQIASRNIASRNDDRTDFNFSGPERLVPEYADPIAETPVEVPNARFARLRENFREGAVAPCRFGQRPPIDQRDCGSSQI